MKKIAGALVAIVAVLALTVPTTWSQQVIDPSDRIGKVSFPVSCKPAVQKAFDQAVAILHSFWYLESAKAFTAVTQADPDCAIAYWGIAMSHWYQIWSPPGPAALKRGVEAMEKAKTVGNPTPRERDYIAAADAFFKDADRLDHRTRAAAYEKAMELVFTRYPQDREAQAFYALALQATADPLQRTYAQHKVAAEIEQTIFATVPAHPGAADYNTHAQLYPAPAQQG